MITPKPCKRRDTEKGPGLKTPCEFKYFNVSRGLCKFLTSSFTLSGKFAFGRTRARRSKGSFEDHLLGSVTTVRSRLYVSNQSGRLGSAALVPSSTLFRRSLGGEKWEKLPWRTQDSRAAEGLCLRPSHPSLSIRLTSHQPHSRNIFFKTLHIR